MVGEEVFGVRRQQICQLKGNKRRSSPVGGGGGAEILESYSCYQINY